MINLSLIKEAAGRLEGVVKQTPLQFNKRLSEKYECKVWLKREDLQEIRSFKIRGAYNKISSLTDEEKKRGVVCASAGNHAQGVAFSCNRMQIKGVIFMPVVTPNQKVNKVKNFGGSFTEIRLEGDTFDDASKAAREYCEKENMVYVHPFDDELVIAGQGTIGLEIINQSEVSPDYVLASIGGGGLIAGIASALNEVSKNTQVIGVESQTQCSMYNSLEKGEVTTLSKVDTFADGTAVKTPGVNTFEIVKKLIKKIVLTTDGQIAIDMIDLYQSEGIVTEPSGALSMSGLESMKSEIKGKNVVCVVSGGNNDLLRYPEILERSLVYRGLKHYLLIEFAQKPGQLKMFLNEALGPNDDIVLFEYIKKNNKEKGPALVGIELVDKNDLEPLMQRLEKAGFKYTKLTQDSMLYQYLV
jgi:threonine dehydratase